MNSYEISQEIERRRIKNEKDRLKRIEFLEQKIPDYAVLRSMRNELLAEAALFRITNRIEEAEANERKAEQLTQNELNLLKKLGLDKSYLEVQYTCKKCNDVGFLEDGSICDCLTHLIHKANHNRYDLNEITQNDTFENSNLQIFSDKPIINPVTKNAIVPRLVAQLMYNKAREYCDNFDSNGGASIQISGDTGTGKTYMVSCIVNELLKKDPNLDIIYISAPNLINLLHDDISEGNSSYDSNKYKFKAADLLVIDDLGTETENDFAKNSISEIIDERLVNNKSTIITTNYSDLSGRYPPRMVSRVGGYFSGLRLLGKDLRLEQNQNNPGENK